MPAGSSSVSEWCWRGLEICRFCQVRRFDTLGRSESFLPTGGIVPHVKGEGQFGWAAGKEETGFSGWSLESGPDGWHDNSLGAL